MRRFFVISCLLMMGISAGCRLASHITDGGALDYLIHWNDIGTGKQVIRPKSDFRFWDGETMRHDDDFMWE